MIFRLQDGSSFFNRLSSEAPSTFHLHFLYMRFSGAPSSPLARIELKLRDAHAAYLLRPLRARSEQSLSAAGPVTL